MSFISGVHLPPVSQEFVDAVDNAFQSPDVRPGADRDILMYHAGARSVVDWIKQFASTKSKTDPIAIQQAVVRYGNDPIR